MVNALYNGLLLFLACCTLSGCRDKQEESPTPALPDADLSITLTPWITPQEELARYFKTSSHIQREKLVFSGVRKELTAQLGRELMPSDSLLMVYKIHDEGQLEGMVIPQKIKGSSGAIEVIVVVDRGLHLRGVRLQKYRGPEAARMELEKKVLPALADLITSNKQPSSILGLSEEARDDGAAIKAGVQSVLTKLQLAEQNSRVVHQADEHGSSINQ